MKTIACWLPIMFTSLLLGACVPFDAGSGGAGEMEIRSGKIEQITQTQMPITIAVLARYWAVWVV
jgi:outer membrane lipoprotein SlyB